VTIRTYQPADTDQIVETWYRASLLATPFLTQAFLDRERRNIRGLWLDETQTWVYEQDGEIAGFMSMMANEVAALFVHPDCHRMGIGSGLLDCALSQFDDIFLDVFEDNTIGRGFYEHYGFQIEYRHMHEESGFSQLRLKFEPLTST